MVTLNQSQVGQPVSLRMLRVDHSVDLVKYFLSYFMADIVLVWGIRGRLNRHGFSGVH